MSRLDDIKAKRAALLEQRRAAEEDQRATDYEAIYAIEDATGEVLRVLEVEHVSGLPCTIGVRAPSAHEVKRYHDRLRLRVSRSGRPETADAIGAQEELGRACTVYPQGEVLDRLEEARPGLRVSAGMAAVALAQAREADEGKD